MDVPMTDAEYYPQFCDAIGTAVSQFVDHCGVAVH